MWILSVLGLVICLSSTWANAEHEYITSVLEVPEIDRGYVALNYTYFSESLDIFDYASKLNSTFKPKESRGVYGTIGFKPLQRILVSYQREGSSASTIRDREPFEVKSDVKGDALLFQWQAIELWRYATQIQIGYALRKQDKLDIACYDYLGLVVGDCASADFTLNEPDTGLVAPALSSSAEESRWLFGVFLKKQYGERFSLSHRLSFTISDVEINTQSTFLDLDDPFLLGFKFNGATLGDTIARIKATFPQDQPWTERVLRYELGANYKMAQNWLLSGSLGYLTVSRSKFNRYEDIPEYESNVLVNSSLWYNPAGGFAVYLRAELTKNYLLGLDSMLYNQRTAKFFEHPYAQITAGAFYTF